MVDRRSFLPTSPAGVLASPRAAGAQSKAIGPSNRTSWRRLAGCNRAMARDPARGAEGTRLAGRRALHRRKPPRTGLLWAKRYLVNEVGSASAATAAANRPLMRRGRNQQRKSATKHASTPSPFG